MGTSIASAMWEASAKRLSHELGKTSISSFSAFMLSISASIEIFPDCRIRFLSSMDCRIFFNTVRRTMALKDMKYCFRPLASDLASLVKLHLARMVSRDSIIDGKWFATGLTAAMRALHLVSDKR